jgi:hypothetical protein
MVFGVAVGAVGASPVSALIMPKDGQGSVGTCAVAGTMKFHPALVTGGNVASPVPVKAKGSTSCSAATGDGLTVTGLTLRGSETAANNSCATGTTTYFASFVAKWKHAAHTPRLINSTLAITLETSATAGDGHRTYDWHGTVTSGSFSGDNVSAHFESDQTAATLNALCGTRQGVKKITFGSVGTNTFTIGVGSTGCGTNIPTKLGITTGSDGNDWVVVVPSVPYTAGCHPTGTLNVTASSFPGCSLGGSVPLEASGGTVADTHPGTVSNGSEFWGTDLFATGSYTDLQLCANYGEETTYSGDSVYLTSPKFP